MIFVSLPGWRSNLHLLGNIFGNCFAVHKNVKSLCKEIRLRDVEETVIDMVGVP